MSEINQKALFDCREPHIIRQLSQQGFHQLLTPLHRQETSFLRIHRQHHHQLVKHLSATANHPLMPVRGRIKTTGIDTNTLHTALNYYSYALLSNTFLLPPAIGKEEYLLIVKRSRENGYPFSLQNIEATKAPAES